MSGKIGSQELKIGSIPATKTFNKLIKGIDRVLTEVLNLAPEPQPGHGFEVFNTKFIPPKWVIGGKQELVECKGRPDVGKEGNIYLKFDPLLEVEFTIDIIVVALAMIANSAGAPYLKDMFLDLRAQAQKGYKSENDNLEAQATLKMDFSLFGRLSADLNWQFLPGEPTKSTGGNKATIGMKLKASVDLILKLFIVKVKMGAEIKIVGEDGAEGVGIDFVVTPSPEGHEPGVAIKCDCTGMKIVYAYYGDVMYGGDSVDSSDNANSSWTQMAKKTKASAKYEGSADIFPAFSIFDTGSTENKEKPKNVSLANLKV